MPRRENVCPKCEGYKKEEYDLCWEGFYGGKRYCSDCGCLMQSVKEWIDSYDTDTGEARWYELMQCPNYSRLNSFFFIGDHDKISRPCKNPYSKS